MSNFVAGHVNKLWFLKLCITSLWTEILHSKWIWSHYFFAFIEKSHWRVNPFYVLFAIFPPRKTRKRLHLALGQKDVTQLWRNKARRRQQALWWTKLDKTSRESVRTYCAAGSRNAVKCSNKLGIPGMTVRYLPSDETSRQKKSLFLLFEKFIFSSRNMYTQT